MTQAFDPGCQACPRLAEYLATSKESFPDYHCGPVAPFGDPEARLLIVGLAPGLHGANATGRPFTGDHAGILLYQMLHDFGFGSAPESVSRDDGLELINCRITNAVKCVPPQNKPTTVEIRECNAFLKAELEGLPADALVLTLGSIAHNAVLRAQGLKLSSCKFGHAALHELPSGLRMLNSYHCSRYNTNTRRLTEAMFADIFRQARDLLG